MNKRFCDQCEKEIGWNDLYYIEEIQAVNFVYRTGDIRKPSDFILSKRDLCSTCSPKTIPASEIAIRESA